MRTRRHTFSRSPRTLGLASILACGCPLTEKNLGQIGESTGEGNDSVTTATDGDGSTAQADPTAGETTAESDGDPVGCVDAAIDHPECHEDPEQDSIRVGCDNAPDHFNPSQEDSDNDEIGNVVDLCPLNASDTNTADSDKDGIGNGCDLCGRTTTFYNEHDAGVSVMDFMYVRNIPSQADADEDGIADVCDNCVATPNCETYGPDNPHEIGDPILDHDAGVACQRDDDADLVGDACAGQMGEGAAGPVGLGAADDFDQDGLRNSTDGCPRQPVPERIVCAGPGDCPADSVCEDDVCDHVDSDGDSIGDICDTCSFSANPNQTMDGAAQEDDEDADFVGEICETNSTCSALADAPPFSFYEVSANGLCCTVALVEDDQGNLVNQIKGQPLVDPDGLPIRVDCDESGDPELLTCRRLPSYLANSLGILSPPPGCGEALALAGIEAVDNPPLTTSDFGGSFDALWNARCTLPQWDQDLDGLGDACDLCPFMFDPDNTVYIDDNGMVWPDAGKYCHGDYDPDAICDAYPDTD